MALVKTPVTTSIPSSTVGVIAEQVAETVETVETVTVTEVEVEVEQPTAVYEAPATTQSVAVAAPQATAVAVAPAVSAVSLKGLENQGFSGLGFDWTSFPTISLKTEGNFVDIDNVDYGKEFNVRLRGSKERYVYRANPVLDNKRDVAFSYDRETTQSGVLLADKFKDWAAQGKSVEEKVYLEVMVEMEAPGTHYDGEYRILSVSPTSKGRFSSAVAKAAALGGGDPSKVVTKVYTTKVLKVANPFWSWNFEIVKD